MRVRARETAIEPWINLKLRIADRGFQIDPGLDRRLPGAHAHSVSIHAAEVRAPVSRTPRCAPGLFRNSLRPCLTSRCEPIATPLGQRFPVFPETPFRKADREVRHSDKR